MESKQKQQPSNMFGKVIATHKTGRNKNNTVSLSLLGEVKEMHDHIIKSQVSAYLFITSHQA